MSLASKALNSLGLVLLAHAVYSAHEHTALSANIASNSTHTSLPVDIIVELLAAVGIVSAGVVLASPQLKPIRWSTWGGEIERTEKGRRENHFRIIEERPNFIDIRGKRKEFAEWIREGGQGQ